MFSQSTEHRPRGARPLAAAPCLAASAWGVVIALFENVALSGGRTLVEKTVRGSEESRVGRLRPAEGGGESFGERETKHYEYVVRKV